MPITRRLRRPARLCAITCALLVPATGSAAYAAAGDRALERYYASYGSADEPPAVSQERYYSSYGAPEPLTPAQSPAAPDETPWITIALSIAGAGAITAASATRLRRVRIRRRRPARTPA